MYVDLLFGTNKGALDVAELQIAMPGWDAEDPVQNAWITAAINKCISYTQLADAHAANICENIAVAIDAEASIVKTSCGGVHVYRLK